MLVDVTYFHSNLTDKINGTAPSAIPGKFTAGHLARRGTREV